MKKAPEQILAIALGLGISIGELLPDTAKKPKTDKIGKTQLLYKNPANKVQTCSGRGRQPKWIVDGLANGQSLDDLRI